jgi:murein DD-endopeptidase MepM/ murein hydrolase activator NlpD
MFRRSSPKSHRKTGLAVLLLAAAWQPVAADEGPGRYVLSYPAAEQFCPPVDGFFDEVQRTVDRVRSHTFRHQPNGGYGLAVVDQVGDAHLLHLGADVGWYRIGDPVFAVANGVVRISEGPPKVTGDEKKSKVPKKLEWGNVVVIEHRLADGKYATTIYGHLASERLVKAGDVVRAGQQIGMIGTTQVNGGYKPHLHLGVREGRMAEVGRKLVLMIADGTGSALEIAEVKEKEKEGVVVLKGGAGLLASLQIGADGPRFDITHTGDNVEVSAGLLSYVPSPEFAIVGYGLSTDGWLDPIAFLKAHSADINPAQFELAKRRRNPPRTAAGAKDREGTAGALRE